MMETNIKMYIKSGTAFCPHSTLQLLELKERTDSHCNFCLQHTEENSVNFTVDMRGENCNCNDICMVRVRKVQRNELCFKTAYTNCECECVNVTWSGSDCVWNGFKVQLKWAYCDCLHISNRKYDELHSTVNKKSQQHCHSTFYSGLKFEQKWFEVSGFSLGTFWIDIYGTVCFWQEKVFGNIIKL